VITLMFLLGLASLGLAARIRATGPRPPRYLRDRPGSGGQAIPSPPLRRKRTPLCHTSLTRPRLRDGTGTTGIDATRITRNGRSSPKPDGK